MALFNRNKKQSILPEVDKYYDGTRRDRTGLAWLLAFVSIAIVTLVIIGAFLGGRWIYRELAGKNDDVSITTTDEPEAPSFDGESKPEEGAQQPPSSNEEENNNPNPEDRPTEQENPSSENRPQDQTPGQTNNQADSQSPTAQAPVTGDDPLPSTGPADLLGIFIGVTLLSAITHNIFIKNSN